MSDYFGEVFLPTARKKHRCAWCGLDINKGEQHVQFKGKWEGEWQNWRMHDDCHSYAQEIDALADGFFMYENSRPTPPNKEDQG